MDWEGRTPGMSATSRPAGTRNYMVITRRRSWEGWGTSRGNMPLLRRGALRRCPSTMTAPRLSAMSSRLVSTGGMREMVDRERRG